MNIGASLAALESQSGYHEGPNNENDFTKWQTDDAWSGAAWCDSFAQWGAAGNGGFVWQDTCQFGPKGDAYCPYTVRHAQDFGLWVDKSSAAQPGWQILFDWTGDGVADHIGTVVEDRGDGRIVTIEGNTSDAALYRLRDRTYVLGFVALTDDAPAPPPAPAPADYDGPHDPDLVWYLRKPMMQGSSIGWLQAFLTQACEQNVGGIDGVYGKATRTGVVNYQRFFGLEIDGVVGGETWNSMQYIAAVKGFSY